jgi:hypothetical protein
MPKTIKMWFTAFFSLSLISCAAVQSGGTLNPLRVGTSSSVTLKAGSSTNFRVSIGRIFNAGLNPADLYNQTTFQVPMSGTGLTSAIPRIAQLSNSSLPGGWNLELSNDNVELQTRSSSVVSFDTITTVTRVELGDYSLGAVLTIPGGTASGTYSVRARVDLRGSNPAMLEWIVQVAP